MSARNDSATKVVDCGQLRIPSAIAFARFLQGPDVNESADLTGISHKGDADFIDFSIEVATPQYPLADIKAVEMMRAIFCAEAEPAVFSLRDDFPRLPHQNLVPKGHPKWICLNAIPWSETRQRWSPSSFLEQIRDWLMKASIGRLHATEQPREPLFANPHAYLIVPHEADFSGVDGLTLSGDLENLPRMMWARYLSATAKPERGNFKLFSFRVPPREHGLIETLPSNLFKLHELCSAQGLDLLNELAELMREIAPACKVTESNFEFNFVLYLQQQLNPGAGSNETTQEEWCFMLSESSVQKMAEILNVSATAGEFTAPVLFQESTSAEDTRGVLVFPIAILRSMTPMKARQHNAVVAPFPKVTALGAGAIGSKVLENLVRAGLEEAVIIDNDRLAPHNTARHTLAGDAVGFFKSESVALRLNYLLESRSADHFKGIVTRYRKNSEHSVMQEAMRSSEFILDFSASVSVSRELSEENDIPRVFSAFLTPGGNSMIVHCEDAERTTRLDWLEAITLRALVENKDLHSCYSSEGQEIWYGGGCREVSTVLPNYKVSIFAAIAANSFTTNHEKQGALCDVFVLNPDTMGVTPIRVEPTQPIDVKCGDWLIRYDSGLIDSLKTMRSNHLPNETGGILLGTFDRERKVCLIVLGSDSPPDSSSWPTEYIRGVEGLKKYVDDVAEITAKQLQYVGEWHSHPDGCTSEPSELDRAAVANLKLVLGREGYPAIALIVSDDPQPYVLFDEWL